MTRWWACAALIAVGHTFAAEPIGAALDRPAQTVRAPERAVLVGGEAMAVPVPVTVLMREALVLLACRERRKAQHRVGRVKGLAIRVPCHVPQLLNR